MSVLHQLLVALAHEMRSADVTKRLVEQRVGHCDEEIVDVKAVQEQPDHARVIDPDADGLDFTACART